MKSIKCILIQELLPLFAEGLVGDETSEYIKNHLRECNSCAQDWEDFVRPLPDPAMMTRPTFEADGSDRAHIRLEADEQHRLYGRLDTGEQHQLLGRLDADGNTHLHDRLDTDDPRSFIGWSDAEHSQMLGRLDADEQRRLLGRLKRTLMAAVLILAIGSTGLAYAFYTAGKHVGMNDPDYRFAQELDLFTEIDQVKEIGGHQVTMEKGLFDGTRSVLFLSLSDSVDTIPKAGLTDQTGREYIGKSARGWQGRYFMLEFEPIALEAEKVTVSLALEEAEGSEAEFTFPVDVTKVVQHSRIIYPNQKKELPGLSIALEKAILGVSESEFKVFFDWSMDGSVAGLGIGRGSAYFPTSVVKAPDTPPPPGIMAPTPGGLMSGYAASCGINYRAADPPDNRPALYDMTSKQEAEAQQGEYSTTQFPCQVEAALKFAPVKQDTKSIELLLPPVYLYESIKDSPGIDLSFEGANELTPGEGIQFPGGQVLVEKVWLEDGQLYMSFAMETREWQDTVLPHFELVDNSGQRQGHMHFDMTKPQTVLFPLFDKNNTAFRVRLDSIGRLQPREKFVLELAE
jgi:hypothetical protein